MKIKYLLTMLNILVLLSPLAAQQDVQIGTLKNDPRTATGFFDFSDPMGINIKVQIWGYVKYPGYYIVPARTALNDLLSFAGGPTEDALLEDVRVIRTNSDSSTTVMRFNYEDLLWSDILEHQKKFPRLIAGDMLLVPGEPRYFFREEVSFYVSITTALASIMALILSITK